MPPKVIEFKAALRKTPSGKISKEVLRAYGLVLKKRLRCTGYLEPRATNDTKQRGTLTAQHRKST